MFINNYNYMFSGLNNLQHKIISIEQFNDYVQVIKISI